MLWVIWPKIRPSGNSGYTIGAHFTILYRWQRVGVGNGRLRLQAIRMMESSAAKDTTEPVGNLPTMSIYCLLLWYLHITQSGRLLKQNRENTLLTLIKTFNYVSDKMRKSVYIKNGLAGPKWQEINISALWRYSSDNFVKFHILQVCTLQLF
jgi:hypothetical protein